MDELVATLSRTFVGIIDDYFDGYYTEEMIESQVLFRIHNLFITLFLEAIASKSLRLR